MSHNTDIVPAQPTGLAVLDDPDGVDIVRDTLVGVDNILGILPRATITATGPAAFTVRDTPVEELRGVIVHSQYGRAYWPSAFSGGGEAPDCSSIDGKTGTPAPEAQVAGGACAQCPMNQFVEGMGKPCKESWTLAIVPEGDLLPILVSVPAASIKAWQAYKLDLGLRAPRFKAEHVITTLRVVKGNTKNRSGINQITFSCDKAQDALSPEAQQQMEAYVASVRPALERQARDLATGGTITPEPGDIDAQAAA